MALISKQYDYGLRAGDNLNPPVMLAPEVKGTPGSAGYQYRASFVTLVGETLPSTPVIVSNGPATLNGVNYIRLSVDSVPAGALKVRYYKKSGTDFMLLGEATPSVIIFDDMGQALNTIVAPTVNTSGRPNWMGMLWNHGRYLQRQELMDQQWLWMRGLKQLGDTIHKNGDIIDGCKEQFLDGQAGAWRWKFTSGTIYYDGQHVPIPEGTVTLTGSGKEAVGLILTPYVVPSTEDAVIRNQDEGVDLSYAQSGADRLIYLITWTVDEPGQILIKEFVDNVAVVVTIPTQRTELDKELARRTYDVSGDFVVRNFPVKMRDHEDADKLWAELAAGKAYPQGYEVETKGVINLEVDKARNFGFDNNSGIDPFVISGGTAVGTTTENFDVDGLKMLLTVGSGNPHTVTFSGNGKTAQQVADAINSSMNAYPTSGYLVGCFAASGHLVVRAVDGKTLTLSAIAGDAYAVLGLQTGTYSTGGQRVYPMNQVYAKDITDLNYLTEVVEAVTHDGTTGKDLMSNPNVNSILGASLTAANAHDGKFDFNLGVDFGRTGNYADFTLYGGADPANGQTLYFRYRYRRNAVKGTRTRVRVIDAQVVKGAEDGKDNIVFTGHTSAYEVVSGNPVAGLSGSVSNVISLLRVNNSMGQSQTEYPQAVLAKNATALGFNISQVDWSQAGAQGDGQPTTGGQYYISFDYWMVSVQGDYLGPDSYIGDYPAIESFSAQNLRDAIDFRTGGIMPVPGESAVFDLTYYLSRADKIVLDKFGKFSVLKGTPALNPVQPPNQEGAIALSVLVLSPYTYTTDDVKVIPLENMRTTQVGIQELRSRIERLEYWQALSTAENKATDRAAAISGKGLFVDPVTGQGRGDVGFNKKGVAFNAAIDPQKGRIRLPAAEDPRILSIDLDSSTNVTKVGSTIIANFTEEAYINQDKASGIINVNPDAVYSWQGVLELDPAQDFYNDVDQLPTATVNFDGNMDALQLVADSVNAENARDITWSSWSLTWDNSGGWAESQLQNATDPHWSTDGTSGLSGDVNAVRERSASVASLVPERQLVDLGSHVVDMTVIPYMRTTYPDSTPFYITCTAKGLKPNQEVAGSIDDVVVDLLPVSPTVAGTHTYKGKTTVMTDASGTAVCKFQMPAGIRVGDKLVKIFRYDNSDDSNCMAQFTSLGFRKTVQDTTVGYATLVERTDTITQTEYHYGDPLAQTFAVTSGIKYISYVKIAFASKAVTLPVTVEIRQVSDTGWPTRKVMQSKTLMPSEVQTSADGTVKTKFSFNNIVGYGPGEYAIVVMANCQEYEVFYAELGGTDLVTGTVIAAQAYDGVMFHSPNNSTWDPYTLRDLKFELGVCNFENDCQVVWDTITGIEASAIAVGISQYLPSGCNLRWSYSLNGSRWTPFVPGLNTELGSIASQVSLLCDVTNSGGSFQLESVYAGIVLLLNKPSANYIAHDVHLSEAVSMPNQVHIYVDLAVDGTNGTGTRTVTPFVSYDDGETWIEVEEVVDYSPVNVGDGTLKEFQFETPETITISDASNTSPIVISSAGHRVHDNQILTIQGVGGNTAANGTWKVVNRTDDTFALVDPVTGANSTGNGAYDTGGTATPAEFDQYRVRFLLETDNQAVSPEIGAINAIAFGSAA